MLGRGESCWLGIHIVRPGSGQKASCCAGRLPRTLRCFKEKIGLGGSSDLVAVFPSVSPNQWRDSPIFRRGKGIWGGQESCTSL